MKIVSGIRDFKRLLRSPGPAKSSLFALAFKNWLLGIKQKTHLPSFPWRWVENFSARIKSLVT